MLVATILKKNSQTTFMVFSAAGKLSIGAGQSLLLRETNFPPVINSISVLNK